MRVNGKDRPCAAEMTVQSFLLELGHDPQRVAVEKNGQIVPRARFAGARRKESPRRRKAHM